MSKLSHFGAECKGASQTVGIKKLQASLLENMLFSFNLLHVIYISQPHTAISTTHKNKKIGDIEILSNFAKSFIAIWPKLEKVSQPPGISRVWDCRTKK